MSTTFIWDIGTMLVYPQADGQTDVVFNVFWICAGIDGEYSASLNSNTTLPAPAGSFTPYADLTLQQVLDWLWSNGVDKTAIENAVQTQINMTKNTSSWSSLPLPWLE